VGPNLAASLLGAELGYQGVFLMCASAALLGLAVYVVLYIKLQQRPKLNQGTSG
jgi:hypothetical protein